MTRLLIAVALTLCLVAPAAPAQETQPAGFQWKCLWVWGLPRKTEQHAIEEVRLTRQGGFNAMVVAATPDYVKMLLPLARAHGLKVFVVRPSVYGEWGFAKYGQVKAPENCLQQYPPEEIEQMKTRNDPDKPFAPGPWLCIDRPEVVQYGVDLAVAEIKDVRPDGLALDWIGYQNYAGCRCDYSNQRRKEFAAAHPDLSPPEAEKAFSLQSIRAYYQAVRAAVKKVDPNLPLMCHIYPQFDPEPFYGNSLPVEYPAQTVAWYFKPHWPIVQVQRNCQRVKSDEHTTYPYLTATGFIGLDMAPNAVKTPDRLRQEIRAIKDAGLRGFCAAGGADFLKDAQLMKVFAEELADR